MSQKGSPDFDLPDELLSLIPTDPYEQLDLARKITSIAISSRVSELELESGRLRQKISERDRIIGELQFDVSRLEAAVQESDAKLQATLEDNVKLSREREMLSLTVKRLTRDLAKLQNFKRQLMQSLNEDNLSLHAEKFDNGTVDSVPNDSLSRGEELVKYKLSDLPHGSTETGSTLQQTLITSEEKISLTPYITPQFTPTVTPKVTSSSTSPRVYSATGSPKVASGVTSPTKARIDGKIVLSSWYPSSQQSSSANSPPCRHVLTGRTPRIDGKEFFRQTRSRLSNEQFGAFLANIKEFNAHKQSREATLKKADEIFGASNKDLYLSFQGMLNRHLP